MHISRILEKSKAEKAQGGEAVASQECLAAGQGKATRVSVAVAERSPQPLPRNAAAIRRGAGKNYSTNRIADLNA